MKVFSVKDAEAFVKTGAKEFRYSLEIKLTPGARDVLSEANIKVIPDISAAIPASASLTPSPAAVPSSVGNQYEAEHVKLFNSSEGERLKREICDIGRRLWQREYTDGNGGNISARIGPNEYICTPTGVSKGFLTPDMMCMVNQDGKQLAGTWKRTSEINTHMAIYLSTPSAKSVCHAHPVHATAFAIAGIEPPPCLIPEIEVFVGKVPLAPYATPGSAEMAAVISPLAPKHQAILMGNHGVICWGTGVEDAYFKMEITDAYCRTLILASHIPNASTFITGEKMKELLNLKQKLGLPDPRFDLKPVQLAEIDPWEIIKDHTPVCTPQESSPVTNAELEALVQQMTDEIIKGLNK